MEELNGGRINRVLIVSGFVLQLVMSIYAYGKLAQKVEDISYRMQRVEQWIDDRAKVK